MTRLIIARKLLCAFIIVLLSTLAVIIIKQMHFGPIRPVPSYRTMGAKNAPIQIYEYTDLSCPACAHANSVVNSLLTPYKDNVALNFKHLPLKMHKWSETAAVYSECAGEQGKFFEYTKMLFEKQEQWVQAEKEPIEFNMYAVQMKLNWDTMKVCVNNPKTLETVRRDTAEANARSLSATPSFFVNGKFLLGIYALTDYAKHFDNIASKAKR